MDPSINNSDTLEQMTQTENDNNLGENSNLITVDQDEVNKKNTDTVVNEENTLNPIQTEDSVEVETNSTITSLNEQPKDIHQDSTIQEEHTEQLPNEESTNSLPQNDEICNSNVIETSTTSVVDENSSQQNTGVVSDAENTSVHDIEENISKIDNVTSNINSENTDTLNTEPLSIIESENTIESNMVVNTENTQQNQVESTPILSNLENNIESNTVNDSSNASIKREYPDITYNSKRTFIDTDNNTLNNRDNNLENQNENINKDSNMNVDDVTNDNNDNSNNNNNNNNENENENENENDTSNINDYNYNYDNDDNNKPMFDSTNEAENHNQILEEDEGQKLRVFCRNVPKQATKEDIINAVSCFGEIESVIIPLDKYTQKKRGFVYVTFKTMEGKERSLTSGSCEVLGSTIDILDAKPLGAKQSNTTRLYISGIPSETNEEELKQFFSTYGKIFNIIVPLDKNTGHNRNFCFVTFTTSEETDAFLKEPIIFKNHTLTATLAKSKAELEHERHQKTNPNYNQSRNYYDNRDSRRDNNRDYGRDNNRDSRRENNRDSRRDRSRDYNYDYNRDYGRDYGRDYNRDYNRDYGRDYNRDYGRDYNRDYERDRNYRNYDNVDNYARNYNDPRDYRQPPNRNYNDYHDRSAPYYPNDNYSSIPPSIPGVSPVNGPQSNYSSTSSPYQSYTNPSYPTTLNNDTYDPLMPTKSLPPSTIPLSMSSTDMNIPPLASVPSSQQPISSIYDPTQVYPSFNTPSAPPMASNKYEDPYTNTYSRYSDNNYINSSIPPPSPIMNDYNSGNPQSNDYYAYNNNNNNNNNNNYNNNTMNPNNDKYSSSIPDSRYNDNQYGYNNNNNNNRYNDRYNNNNRYNNRYNNDRSQENQNTYNNNNNNIGPSRAFVAGLDPSITEKDLVSLFSPYGRVISARIPDNHKSGTKSDFALVTMNSWDEVQNAINNAPRVINGKPIKDICKARPKDSYLSGNRSYDRKRN